MSTSIKDPKAEQYLELQRQAKKKNAVTFDLLMLLGKLGVCPMREIGKNKYPLSHRAPAFKDFYWSRKK